MIELTTILPPSVNGRYQRGRNGNLILTGQTRAYQAEVALLVRNQCALKGVRLMPPLAVQVRLMMGKSGMDIRDIDNGLKAILDGIAAGTGINDSRVHDLSVRKRQAPNGHESCVIRIYGKGEQR